MPEPVWREIVTRLNVPKSKGIIWTVALDYVAPESLLKIQVCGSTVVGGTLFGDGRWLPLGFAAPCTADGDVGDTCRGSLPAPVPLLASAPVGALIGKIGGSSADITADTGNPPSRILFSVGRQCVLLVPQTVVGSLFLGINDAAARLGGVEGSLLVNVSTAV
jgi:hypothetical protein